MTAETRRCPTPRSTWPSGRRRRRSPGCRRSAAGDVRVTGGFWAERLRTNRERTIPHGLEQLRRGREPVELRSWRPAPTAGIGRSARTTGVIFPFLDTDVYKWLEAVGWELGRERDRVLAASADEVIGLVERAQREDGYLNTYVQVVAPGREYAGPRLGPRAVLLRAPDPGGGRLAARAR